MASSRSSSGSVFAIDETKSAIPTYDCRTHRHVANRPPIKATSCQSTNLFPTTGLHRKSTLVTRTKWNPRHHNRRPHLRRPSIRQLQARTSAKYSKLQIHMLTHGDESRRTGTFRSTEGHDFQLKSSPPTDMANEHCWLSRLMSLLLRCRQRKTIYRCENDGFHTKVYTMLKGPYEQLIPRSLKRYARSLNDPPNPVSDTESEPDIQSSSCRTSVRMPSFGRTVWDRAKTATASQSKSPPLSHGHPLHCFEVWLLTSALTSAYHTLVSTLEHHRVASHVRESHFRGARTTCNIVQ